jgi:hypothetical protein
MKLTKEEQKIILDKRAKEDANKPKKIGYLTNDLYTSKNQSYKIDSWVFDEFEKNEIIKNFTESIIKVCSAGDIFDCFIDDGEEQWYGGVIEGRPKKWAEKYLSDIRTIVRKSRKKAATKKK